MERKQRWIMMSSSTIQQIIKQVQIDCDYAEYYYKYRLYSTKTTEFLKVKNLFRYKRKKFWFGRYNLDKKWKIYKDGYWNQN